MPRIRENVRHVNVFSLVADGSFLLNISVDVFPGYFLHLCGLVKTTIQTEKVFLKADCESTGVQRGEGGPSCWGANQR